MAVTAPLSTWSLPLARVEIQCAQQGLWDQSTADSDHEYRLDLARHGGGASKNHYILDVHCGGKLMIKLRLHDLLLSCPDDSVSIEQTTRRVNISIRSDHFSTPCLVILDFASDRNYDIFAALLQRIGFKLRSQASERLSFITPLSSQESLAGSQSGPSSPSQETWSPTSYDGQSGSDQLVSYRPQPNPYAFYSGKPVADSYRPRQSSPLRRTFSNTANPRISATNAFDRALSQQTTNPSTELLRAASFNSYSQSQHTQRTDLGLGLTSSSQLNDSLHSHHVIPEDTVESSLESRSNSRERADTEAEFARMLPQQRLLPFKDPSRKRSTASSASDQELECSPDRSPAKRHKPNQDLSSTPGTADNKPSTAMITPVVRNPRNRIPSRKGLSNLEGQNVTLPQTLVLKPVLQPSVKETEKSMVPTAGPPRARSTPYRRPAQPKPTKSLIVTLRVPRLSTVSSASKPKSQNLKLTPVKTPKAGSRATGKVNEQWKSPTRRGPSTMSSVTNTPMKRTPRRKALPPPPPRKAITARGEYENTGKVQQDPSVVASSALDLRPSRNRINSLRSANKGTTSPPKTTEEQNLRTKRKATTPRGTRRNPNSSNSPANVQVPHPAKVIVARPSAMGPSREVDSVSERQAGSLALMSLRNRKREANLQDILGFPQSGRPLPAPTCEEMVRYGTTLETLPKPFPKMPEQLPLLVTEVMLTELHQVENRFLDQYEEDIKRGLNRRTLMQYYGHHLVKARSEFWVRNLTEKNTPATGVMPGVML